MIIDIIATQIKNIVIKEICQGVFLDFTPQQAWTGDIKIITPIEKILATFNNLVNAVLENLIIRWRNHESVPYTFAEPFRILNILHENRAVTFYNILKRYQWRHFDIKVYASLLV